MMLSPRLLSMLRILSMPYPQIILEIEKASEENPFIEIEQHDSLMEYLRYLGKNKKIRKEVDYNEYPGLENIKENQKSLMDFLSDQIKLVELDDTEEKIAEQIISEIDPNGYIKKYDEIKAGLIGNFKVSGPAVDKVLEVIQSLEPEGVGARDLKECLMIQVKGYGFDSPELEELIGKAISDHFDDLANKDFNKIALSLNITESGAQEVANFIKQNLNPYPASGFGEEAQTIIPSFAVEYQEQEITLINLEEKYGPKVGLSPQYEKMLKSPKTDKETVKFLKEKFDKAKEMLEDLKKRGETSQAIMNIILETQKEYFEGGRTCLVPLEQKDLALKLGLHPSTISRAVSGKYIQTPSGMIPIKILCQRGFKGFSQAAIKEKILGIVTNEDKKYPLDDQDIKGLLLKDGIQVERRTIASYRKQLGILPSNERGKL